MVTKKQLRKELARSTAEMRRYFDMVAESMRDDSRITHLVTL